MKTSTLPQVSVVIPAFNAEAYLARAVDSVLEQKDCSYEIIIVNNGSTDATETIARKYASSYPEIIYVLQELKPGASAARNCGLFASNAPWIQFLDADDCLLPGKLWRQTEMVTERVNWIVGTIRLRETNGITTDAVPIQDHWFGLLTYTGMGHLNSNLFRKTKLKEIGGFEESFIGCEDFDLFFRFHLKFGAPLIDLVPGAVHIHHMGPRITNEKQKEMAEQRIELSHKMNLYLRRHLPVYSSQNEALLKTTLLNSIRQQVAHSLKKANINFQTFFPLGYHRSNFRSDLLPKYEPLYLIFGVIFTEQIRVFFAKWTPIHWKRRFKKKHPGQTLPFI